MSIPVPHSPHTPHPLDACMDRAIALAERGRWKACPNPTVGAVLARDGRIVAEGWHTACGQAHAEVECLRDARDKHIDPAQCTLVVTLEPCHHQGKTPPCTRAILDAGIRHVVVGLRDPNPVAAGGLEYLAEQGVRVEYGVRIAQCRDLVADFLVWQTSKRPYVLLKMAGTLDGRIGTRTGHSRWISGEASRAAVQRLRTGVGLCGGAVLIGGGTFRADNPHLNIHPDDAVPDTARHPLACIMTSRLPAPDADMFLLRHRPTETLFLATPAAAASPLAAALREQGVRIWGFAPSGLGQGTDLEQILTRLRQELGCPYILCEGGGKLALSLLNAGLVDAFHLHLSPKILGDNEARPLFDGRSPLNMEEALPLRISDHRICQEDLHVILRPR